MTYSGLKCRLEGTLIVSCVLHICVLWSGCARPSPLYTHHATVAQTPPMGWSSWNHFECGVSEAIVRAQADGMVSSGMRDIGYTYVNIDECWEGSRDANGTIWPNSKFGDMAQLAKYIHSRGLKLGIYSSPGALTCRGYTGSLGHEYQDAQTYASWGIDYLKYDWCFATGDQAGAYQLMSDALKATGRPIVYSISQSGRNQVWTWAASVGVNLWRVTGDIADNYAVMLDIGLSQNGREIYAGAGHWNDPDMLEIGNGGMTTDEYRSHMSLWCILAAPLIAGNDLTSMNQTTIDLLTNSEVIAVDQDSAGIQGHRASQNGLLEVWVKPLADRSMAVALFNSGIKGATVTANFSDLGIGDSATVRDLWARQDLGVYRNSFSAFVPSHGAILVRMVGLAIPNATPGSQFAPNLDAGLTVREVN